MGKSILATAALDFVLIVPAGLFMAALVARNLQLDGVAVAAQRIVMWYAGKAWTLWILLLALPFTVLLTGCAALLHERIAISNTAGRRLPLIQAEPLSIVVAALALSAVVILAIVILHMLAN